MREADFSHKVKDILAKRVAFHCSNPNCRMSTTGPNEDSGKSTNIGVAAHITAAAEGGARFNTDISLQERKDINNGIWLCHSCSTLIDRDPSKYTKELLHSWKIQAEQTANQELNRQMTQLAGSEVIAEFGYEPIEENAYYEKVFEGGIVRYYLKNGLIHVEHELKPDCIAYYVIDKDGNLADYKLPYPLEDYDVEIDPSLVIREEIKILEEGIELRRFDLKWGKQAKIYRNLEGKLLQVELLGGGGTISNRQKKLFFTIPEFKK